MLKSLMIVAILSLLTVSTAFAQDHTICGSRDRLTALLNMKGEANIGGGTSRFGLPMVTETFVNEETRDWTIIRSDEKMRACIVDIGTGYRTPEDDVPPEALSTGEPDIPIPRPIPEPAEPEEELIRLEETV